MRRSSGSGCDIPGWGAFDCGDPEVGEDECRSGFTNVFLILASSLTYLGPIGEVLNEGIMMNYLTRLH